MCPGIPEDFTLVVLKGFGWINKVALKNEMEWKVFICDLYSAPILINVA